MEVRGSRIEDGESRSAAIFYPLFSILYPRFSILYLRFSILPGIPFLAKFLMHCLKPASVTRHLLQTTTVEVSMEDA